MRRSPILLALLLAGGGCTDAGPASPELQAVVSGLFRTPSSFRVGDVLTLDAAEAGTLVVPGGGSGATYVYVPFNASDSAAAHLALEVRGANLEAGGGDASAFRGVAAGAALRAARPAGPVPDRSFHLRLRERERRALTRLRRGAGPRRAARLAAAPYFIPATFSVGDTLVLNANADDPCDHPDLRRARVVAVGDRAVVVEDRANPAGGFNALEYQHVAAVMDSLIYPVDVQYFGEPAYGAFVRPTDRVIIFYTRAVNDLTEPGANSFVGGFFFGRDLFPREGTGELGACATSNQAPIMYMLAPDPNGEAGNVRTHDFVFDVTLSTVAHELQHLINESRRLFASTGADFEEVWLNEGLSHVAEELMFYHTTGLAPRQNLGVQALASSDHNVDMFFTYAVANFDRYIQYLENPDTASLLGEDQLPTRGAAWAFLRYAADRDPGDDAAFFRKLVDGPATGLANLQAALGSDPIDAMQAWTAAVYADDAPVSTAFPSAYQQPSWNFRSIIGALQDSNGNRLYPEFPLQVRELTSEERTLELLGGGAAFFRFSVAPGTEATVVATSGGAVPDERLRISVLRVR